MTMATIGIIPAIKYLKIMNTGLLRRRNLKFTKGINIICGASGCGKSQIIDILSNMFREDKVYCSDTNKRHSHKGRIVVELLEIPICYECDEFLLKPRRSKKHVSLSGWIILAVPRLINRAINETIKIADRERAIRKREILVDRVSRAILLDGVFEQLDREKRKFVWGLLKKSGLQVIATAHSKDEMTEKANIIQLPLIRKP